MRGRRTPFVPWWFWLVAMAVIATNLWLYFLGGPCTGTVTEVPAWCINR